jgi:predicted O-methyltransferase YrrM
MEASNYYSHELEEYISQHTSPEDEVLYELNRHTHLTAYHPRMLCGQMQGKLLELICKMINPLHVLEIGTFTGYSSICIARGLPGKGHLHTIEVNDEITEQTLEFFSKAGVKNLITLHVGDALKIIPTLDELFEMVFIDGDKREYPQYLQAILPKVKVGGFILADNVLWGSKVLDKEACDDYTNGVRDFNLMIANNSKLEKVFLPLRDGLMIARKIE